MQTKERSLPLIIESKSQEIIISMIKKRVLNWIWIEIMIKIGNK